MLNQWLTAVLLILGVIGCFRLQDWGETYLRRQSARGQVQRYARIGGIVGAGVAFAGVALVVTLAISSTGYPLNGGIIWSMLLGIVFVLGGGLLGNIVGTVFGWLIIALRRG